MKKMMIVLATAAMGMMGVAHAADNPTVSKRQVHYTCQSGKKVTVTYGFNKQNLPTYASFVAKGKTRKLPINLDLSDIAGHTFGKDGGYMIGTDYFEKSTVRKTSVLITAPDNYILFKNCNAR